MPENVTQTQDKAVSVHLSLDCKALPPSDFLFRTKPVRMPVREEGLILKSSISPSPYSDILALWL